MASAGLVISSLSPSLLFAQEPTPTPEPTIVSTEPKGLIPEADIILRAALFADRQLGKGDINNGWYPDFSSMIPGAGALAIGPGYRHWFAKDNVFIDGAAAVSVNGYKQVRGRIELPALLKSRVVLGTESRWLDFDQVAYYGRGPDSTPQALSLYRLRGEALAGYVNYQPRRWMTFGTRFGWMNPTVTPKSGPLGLQQVEAKRTFVPVEAGFSIDTRDFPGHPTRGGVLHGVAARYFDHGPNAIYNFDRLDGEAAGFLPLFGSRIVLAVHGWAVATGTDPGHDVPFFLEPNLGGANTLRSFADYRFHDRNMLMATAEVRVAMMTHMDFALFTDAGNVAPRFDELNLEHQSYGGGFRFHTRRETFAMVDAARGSEGWRVMFRMSDPLLLARVARRSLPIPFVP